MLSLFISGSIDSYNENVKLSFSGQANWKDLLEAGDSVLKNVPGINRCIWNLGPKAPVETLALSATVTPDRLELLRQADFLMMQGLKQHGIYNKIWQCPTVLVPIEIDGRGKELVVLRPIYSKRAMTASAANLPGRLIEELKESILSLNGVSGLALDITSKPPGTIEWE
jgi:hypothetical protein